jgi:hypothetical protein
MKIVLLALGICILLAAIVLLIIAAVRYQCDSTNSTNSTDTGSNSSSSSSSGTGISAAVERGLNLQTQPTAFQPFQTFQALHANADKGAMIPLKTTENGDVSTGGAMIQALHANADKGAMIPLNTPATKGAMIPLLNTTENGGLNAGAKGSVEVDSVIVGSAGVWGVRKSRRVLPFSSDNEMACSASYECAPMVKALRSGAKAAGGFRPCDPAITASPFPYFPQAGRRRIFFGVGINYLSQPHNRLTSCWNDVDMIQSLFNARYGSFDQVYLLIDRNAPTTTAPPTLSSLRQNWTRMLTAANQMTGDVDLFFIYSGHGTFRLTNDVSELGGQSDALVLLDSLLYDYEVMSQLIRPLPNKIRLFILFDSCNSGSAANLPWTFNPLSNTVNQTSLNTDLTNDVIMISGCRDEQTSAAGPTERDPSECTRVFLETLRDHPAANTVSITDLVKSMRAKLAAANDTQIPQLSISKPNLLTALL